MSLTQRQWALGGIAMTVVLIISIVFWGDRERPAVYPLHKRIQYRFQVTNPSQQLLKQVEFRVYAPVKLTATQKAGRIDTSLPYTIEQDALDNQILRFRFDLAPNGRKQITIDAAVTVAATPNDIVVINPALFLQEEAYVELAAPEIKALAAELRAGDAATTVAKIYQWLVDNMAAKDYSREDRGALYALHQRQGDCTEFMYLTLALARSVGVPARGLGGYVVTESGRLQPARYHNWAEVYVDGTWRLVDAHSGVMRQHEADYIAMRVVSHRLKNPMGNSHQFMVAGDQPLKVKMY